MRFLLPLCFVLWAGDAVACVCISRFDGDLGEHVRVMRDHATAVFVASAEAVTRRDSLLDRLLGRRGTTSALKVIESFKGDVAGTIELESDGTSCDFEFEEGGIYLVYASTFLGQLTVGPCSRTRRIDGMNDVEIAWLRGVAVPWPPVAVRREVLECGIRGAEGICDPDSWRTRWLAVEDPSAARCSTFGNPARLRCRFEVDHHPLVTIPVGPILSCRAEDEFGRDFTCSLVSSP